MKIAVVLFTVMSSAFLAKSYLVMTWHGHEGGNRRHSEKRGYLQLLWLHLHVSINLSVVCYANLGVVLNFRHLSMMWLAQNK